MFRNKVRAQLQYNTRRNNIRVYENTPYDYFLRTCKTVCTFYTKYIYTEIKYKMIFSELRTAEPDSENLNLTNVLERQAKNKATLLQTVYRHTTFAWHIPAIVALKRTRSVQIQQANATCRFSLRYLADSF